MQLYIGPCEWSCDGNTDCESTSVVLKKEKCTKQWSVCVLLVFLDVLSESSQIMRPVAVVDMCLNCLELSWNFYYEFVDAQKFVHATLLHYELSRPLL